MKTIAIPGFRDLDIAPYLPIIDHWLFQRLGRVGQLGPTCAIFRGADHTRFTHSLATLQLTRERTHRWHEAGIISPSQKTNLRIYGLTHDLGHLAGSHAMEGICAFNHHTNGLRVLEQLRDQIEKCGGNMDEVVSLHKRQDPLFQCVAHHVTGTDPLSYLKLDGRQSTDAISFRTDDIINYIHFANDRLVAELRILAEIIQVERAYVDMYTRVYLRKAAIIAQHFFRQIVAQALARQVLTAERLAESADDELSAVMLTAQDSTIRSLWQRLLDRLLPKTAVAILPRNVVTLDRLAGKSTAVFRQPIEMIDRFNSFHERDVAAQHETVIANLACIPPEAVLITPPVHLNRIMPQDIAISDGPHVLGTLHEIRPRHYASLIEAAEAHKAVRVCVVKEHRERVADPSVAGAIFEYLMSTVS